MKRNSWLPLLSGSLATTSVHQNMASARKKMLYGSALVAVIVAPIAAWFFLARNNPNQANRVEITGFSREPGIDQNNGYLYRFAVSVQNKGNNSVSGVILSVRMLGNDETELVRSTRQFSTLSPGEGETITGGLYLQIGKGVGKTPFSYVATIKLGDLVLDEERIP